MVKVRISFFPFLDFSNHLGEVSKKDKRIETTNFRPFSCLLLLLAKKKKFETKNSNNFGKGIFDVKTIQIARLLIFFKFLLH
jgi:hypothetical protein